MGLMVEIANVRSNPRFSMLRSQTGDVYSYGADCRVTRPAVLESSRDKRRSEFFCCTANRCKKKNSNGRSGMIEYERLGEEKRGLRTAQRQWSTTKHMKGASGFSVRAFPNQGCRLYI
jgi:hypothetical protein